MTRSTDQDPIPIPPEQRWEEFRSRRLPVVIWLACVLIVGVSLLNRSLDHRHVAIAQAREFEISAPRDGVLVDVAVELLDAVEPGELIASINDPELEELLTVSDATTRQLRDQIEAARATHRAEGSRWAAQWENDRRRFRMDEEDRLLDLLALRVEVESERVAEERLALEARRARALFESDLLSETEADAAHLLHQEARERLAENERLLGRMEQEVGVSSARRTEYERESPQPAHEESILKPLERAAEVEFARLAKLQAQRDALLLRSPVAGQVTQILARKDQAVIAGEPVAVVTERSVREIVAYLLEHERFAVGPNTPVVLTSRVRDVSGESMVVRVTEALQPLPARLWSDPRVATYGRAVVIAPVPGMDLAPGEVLEVRFGRPR